MALRGSTSPAWLGSAHSLSFGATALYLLFFLVGLSEEHATAASPYYDDRWMDEDGNIVFETSGARAGSHAGATATLPIDGPNPGTGRGAPAATTRTIRAERLMEPTLQINSSFVPYTTPTSINTPTPAITTVLTPNILETIPTIADQPESRLSASDLNALLDKVKEILNKSNSTDNSAILVSAGDAKVLRDTLDQVMKIVDHKDVKVTTASPVTEAPSTEPETSTTPQSALLPLEDLSEESNDVEDDSHMTIIEEPLPIPPMTVPPQTTAAPVILEAEETTVPSDVTVIEKELPKDTLYEGDTRTTRAPVTKLPHEDIVIDAASVPGTPANKCNTTPDEFEFQMFYITALYMHDLLRKEGTIWKSTSPGFINSVRNVFKCFFFRSCANVTHQTYKLDKKIDDNWGASNLKKREAHPTSFPCDCSTEVNNLLAMLN